MDEQKRLHLRGRPTIQVDDQLEVEGTTRTVGSVSVGEDVPLGPWTTVELKSEGQTPFVELQGEELDKIKQAMEAEQGDRWGRWTYGQDNGAGVLTIETQSGAPYTVRMARLDTPERIAHTLAHLANKTWITPTDLGNFVHALHHLIGLPRGEL